MYGLQILDTSGNKNIVTPETATIISCGTATMPNSLNVDDTYGLDIDLPGTESISTDNIGVILLPHGNIHYENHVIYFNFDRNVFSPTLYLDNNNYNYYTKNNSTGVMTSFTPGNRTNGNSSTWDPIAAIFPSYGWDRIADNITSVRLWAATAYIILDGCSDFKAVYSIGNTGGIEQIDYAIFLKEWDY